MGCGVYGTPPRAGGCWLSSADKAFQVRTKAKPAVNDGYAPICSAVRAALAAAAPYAIAGHILGIAHFPVRLGLKLFFCHHGVSLSGLFGHCTAPCRLPWLECNTAPCHLSSDFFKIFQGPEGSPVGGKFLIRPRLGVAMRRGMWYNPNQRGGVKSAAPLAQSGGDTHQTAGAV